MPALTGIHLSLGRDSLEPLLADVVDLPGIDGEAASVLRIAETLIDPRMVYQWVDVLDVGRETVTISPGQRRQAVVFQTGRLTYVIAPARMALVSVVTIGGALDLEVRRLNDHGEPFQAYLLDHLGGVALGQAGRVAFHLAEDKAKSRGWSVGPCLAPGAVRGWSLDDQSVLCSLLALEQIEVSLTELGILSPFKSASSLIALGPEFTSSRASDICTFCQRATQCKRRSGSQLWE